MNSLEISNLFLVAASEMDLSKDFDKAQDFKEMGYWWKSKHLLNYEFRKLINTNFLFDLALFPYSVYRWRKYYKKSSILELQFNNLALIKNVKV